MRNTFRTETRLEVGGAAYTVYSLATLAKEHPGLATLPYSLKVLLENLLRYEDGRVVRREDILALVSWDPKAQPDTEIAYHPARVLMQDFTGVPAVVDLAAMREAVVAMGGDAKRIRSLPIGAGWTVSRDFPAPSGRTFREMYRERRRGVQPASTRK